MAELKSTITCPVCGHANAETMPIDACQYFYDCKGCGAVLRPKAGDCCVFCSYGTLPCPPVQVVREGAEQDRQTDGEKGCQRPPRARQKQEGEDARRSEREDVRNDHPDENTGSFFGSGRGVA